MMTSTPGWNAAASNSPWDSPVAPVAAPQISQSQTHGWNQNYNTAAVSAVSMHPPPPSVSSQYNQFNFGSNSYDSFRNQRTSLPSPNMNHQFLGTNGLSTSGKEIKRGSVFDHIMDTFGSSGELDVNRPVFWAYMPFLDALSNFRP